MGTTTESRIAERIRLVDEHVRVENEHDIDATMRTFGATPRSVINGVSTHVKVKKSGRVSSRQYSRVL